MEKVKENIMTHLICDATRKTIKNAKKDVNYVVIMGKTLSMDAKYDLLQRVSNAISRKPEFSFTEYKRIFANTLLKMCGQ
jgi:hypothetical protein